MQCAATRKLKPGGRRLTARDQQVDSLKPSKNDPAFVPRDGVFQKFFAFRRNRAMLADHLRHHLRVGISLFLVLEPFELPVSRGNHPLPDGSRVLRGRRRPYLYFTAGTSMWISMRSRSGP